MVPFSIPVSAAPTPYDNVLYLVAGKVIEVVSSKPLEYVS